MIWLRCSPTWFSEMSVMSFFSRYSDIDFVSGCFSFSLRQISMILKDFVLNGVVSFFFISMFLCFWSNNRQSLEGCTDFSFCWNKEYEIKTKIVQEQWLQLKMKFLKFEVSIFYSKIPFETPIFIRTRLYTDVSSNKFFPLV